MRLRVAATSTANHSSALKDSPVLLFDVLRERSFLELRHVVLSRDQPCRTRLTRQRIADDPGRILDQSAVTLPLRMIEGSVLRGFFAA